MPRIVPLQLLKCLRVLLDDNGGIASPAEVKRIAGLMTKYSKKLVSKCVYVQILKSTKTELLGDFMAVGGWSLVYTWLNDAIRAMNWPLVQEILELLLLSPVDVIRLRINSAPILVKNLCKDGGNEGVRILAKKLVEQWLKIVTENSTEKGPAPRTSVVATTTVTSAPEPGSIIKPDQPHFNEQNSSDSNDSGGATPTVNYTITSTVRKSNATDSLVLKFKPVDKATSVSADGHTNENSVSAVGSENGSVSDMEADADAEAESKANATLDNSDNIDLDVSSTAEVKTGEENDRKYKRSTSREKSKKSDKDRDKDKKSSSHRSSSSSSSSHKSSSSSTSSSSKSSPKSSSSSSSSSHRSSSSSDKHRDKDKSRSSSSKDKDRSSSSSSSKHKSSSSSSKSPSSSTSSSSSSSSSKDRNRDKDKTSIGSSLKKDGNEKDVKLMPPPSAASSDKKLKDTEPKSIQIPSRKASISIEIRRDTEKTATVKTYQSKFRSHGLTEEAPPPPSRKGLKKPTSSTTGTTPTSLLSATTLKRLSPSNETPSGVEKKTKIDINNVSGHVERPGAAKLIAPKKIQTLVETNLFSDALAASIEPKKVVKRKRPNAAAPSPTEKDAPALTPLKFYQDTLDESKSDDKSDDSTRDADGGSATSPTPDDDDIPLKKVKEDIEQQVQKEKEAAEDAIEDEGPPEPKKPGPGCGPDGPPGVLLLHRRKGPKKKLTWQPEDKLTQIRYFEIDRSERVNVTKQSFLEMKNLERYSERDAMNIARRGFDDAMEAQMEWRPLIEVDNVPDHPNGNLSKQRTVEAERQATTLRALYFSPDMIPDSPAEAELEPHFSHDIPVIPMDDLTGNPDAVNDYSSLPWPEPKGYATAMNLANTSEPPLGAHLMMNNNNNNNMMGPNIMGGGNGGGGGMGNINPFQPFGVSPAFNQQMGPGPAIWQNQMNSGPGPGPGPMHPMNDHNSPMGGGGGGGPPPNFMGNGPPGPFGNPGGPFNGPGPGFNNNNMNNMNFPPMNMMNGGMNGNGGGGPMGPMGNGGGPRNRNKNSGGGGNWRSGGNNFHDNSGGGGGGGGGGNWRSAGSGPNRGGGGGGGNTGICKQFMRGHCHMGKSCKYIHPQKKRL